MLGTVTRYSTWCNLSTFCRKIPEGPGILIVDQQIAIRTKLTYLPSVIGSFKSTAPGILTGTWSTVCHFFTRASLRLHHFDPGLRFLPVELHRLIEQHLPQFFPLKPLGPLYR